MDELTRFARQLVDRLNSRPEGIGRPVSIAEVRKTLLPYRAQRRALGLESVEDYETVLLRLVAEERGYVKTAPPGAAERCREELGQSTPDLALLDELAEATIQLTSLAAGRILSDGNAEPAASTVPRKETPVVKAPPPPPPAPAPEPPAAPVPSSAAPRQAQPRAEAAKVSGSESCRHCQGALPVGRTATFCPHCGERLIPLTCGRCGTEFESGWQHCITCGAAVQDPFPK